MKYAKTFQQARVSPKQKAFTLIELLVVMVIVGILTTISTAVFKAYINDAHVVPGIEFERLVEQQMEIRMNKEGKETYHEFLFENSNIDETGNTTLSLSNAGAPGTLEYSEDTPKPNSDYSVQYNGGVYQRGTSTGISSLPEVTVSAWINPTAIERASIFFVNGSCTTGLFFYPFGSTDLLYYNPAKTCANTSAVAWQVHAQNAITLERWQHILFTDDGTESRLYVDGNLVGSQTHPQTAIRFDTLWTGLMFSGGDHDYKMDDLKVWPIAYDPEY